MAPTDKVLVYHYRAGKKNQPTTMTQAKLDKEISNSRGSLQATTKPITASVVFIQERDLRTPEQQAVWDSKPNSEAEVASVKIPFVKRVFGGFKELVILSEAKVLDGK